MSKFISIVKSNLSYNYQFYSINSVTCFFITEGFSSDKLSSCCDMITYFDSFWYSTHNWGNFVKFMEESDDWSILDCIVNDEWEENEDEELVYGEGQWSVLAKESSEMVLYDELFFFEWYSPLDSCEEVIVYMEEITYVEDSNFMKLSFYQPDITSMVSVNSSGLSFCKKYFSLDFESEESNFVYCFSFMYLFEEFKMFQPLLSKFNFLNSEKLCVSYLKFSCLGFSHNVFVWGSSRMPFSCRSKMFLYKLKGK